MTAPPDAFASCANHPAVHEGLAPCTRCQRPFCADCRIELKGRLVCAVCKEEEVRDLISGVAPGAEQELWFAVTPAKYIALSLCSLGIYSLYWVYKQWVVIKRREHSDVMPFWRAALAVFYLNQLFKRVQESARRTGVYVGWSSGSMVALYLFSSLAYRVPGPAMLLGFASIFSMLPAVLNIAAVNAKVAPEADRNGRFGPANIALLVVGGLLFMATVAGAFLPDPGR